eukprot:TRINITY_DN1635_c0_g1_i1.p3 TRINITY_DN1635_c0_g1~~TRINITY_DN1635_c0_g1_i1.p3  ORF type:complete len:364 (-),score=47.41 TRINITY_DN1635_c0_g1_i1:5498-6589(-)
MSPRNIIEELDILFVKECYTKGYRIIKDGEYNENVYFIKSGVCKLLQPIAGPLNPVKAQMTPEEQANHKYIALCDLGIGQAFGEDSALNSSKAQETVEAESEKVEAYKISKSMLLQYFGGSASEVIYAVRAGVQAKKNWIHLKLQQLASARKEDLAEAGLFRDETEYRSLNPSKTVPGEVPYLKMVQTYGKPAAGSMLKLDKMEEQKAPEPVARPPPAPKPEFRPKPRNEFMVEKAPNEEHRDDKLRGFGTMRLVASDRMKNINSQQMKSLIALRSIAHDVKTGGKMKQEPKTDFNRDSLKKFQNTVMMADPAIAEKAKDGANGPGAAAGSDFFKKMRGFNPEALKGKFGQQFLGPASYYVII